jgi:hypothetical protein
VRAAASESTGINDGYLITEGGGSLITEGDR